LVAALAAGISVYALSNNVSDTAIAAVQPTPLPQSTLDIVVANGDIEPSTVLTNSNLTTRPYVRDSVPTGAFTDTAKLIGSTTVQTIYSGQPIIDKEFFDAGGRNGIVSSVIPQGKVLAAFPSTDILNSTGAIQRGDHVDILLSIPISGTARIDAGARTTSQVGGTTTLVSQATLQNIEVYSVGTWAPGGGGQPAQPGAGQKIVTFLVEHQEALILKYVKDSGGTIDIVVRSLKDGDLVKTDPVNIDYLVDLYKFIGLPSAPTP